MHRRQLLKYLGLSGMALTVPAGRLAAAENTRHWICVNAGGGWDPTAFLDPKGNAPRSDGRGPINNYSTGAIEQVGNIRFPGSYPDDAEEPALDSPAHFKNFFPRHASDLLVINGIDTQTNNHDAGSRYVWSGRIEEGYPSFAALAAASAAPKRALAFISNGGYDRTASLVAPARIGDGDVFERLAFPMASRPGAEEGERRDFFPTEIYDDIERARSERLARLAANSTLPLQRSQINELQLLRSGDSELHRLVSILPDRVSNGLAGQAEVAVAAFAAGVAVSANLHLSGFDTHGNHDFNQGRRISELLAGLDHLMNEIDRLGIRDRVTVVVGSDFGRTPFYNDNRGKDHWNVTSMMMLGAGVRGDRVVGTTNDLFESVPINPVSLAPDESGVLLTPEIVHHSLRSLGAIDTGLTARYALRDDSLNLFA